MFNQPQTVEVVKPVALTPPCPVNHRISRAFEDLGAQILDINLKNGWNVTTPEDWIGSPDASQAILKNTAIARQIQERKQLARR